jgi:hypothetical protein
MKLNREMKSVMKAVWVVCALCLVQGSLYAQQNGAYDFPSDISQLPYDVEEMTELIQSSLEGPQPTNAYVQMVMGAEGFPEIVLGQPFKKSQVKQLTEWVETHPEDIEALLIARKKNYDEMLHPNNGLNN